MSASSGRCLTSPPDLGAKKDSSPTFPHQRGQGPGELLNVQGSPQGQENGLTLLHLVVIQGNVEKLKFLLSQEANMDIQLVCGYTPLIVAVQKRSPEISQF
ncbi:hypothetical protein KIL84_008427 [Mauremys mutica]|uniref:Uncharacterized protein n=1 Tax=Mauremys mutica TaxID=74926 RepID=A0A9D3X9Z0_9SAUR|nr:hypothetical protein KIL84_008427 [Mauremys mutica]